eukprot:516469-Hanusia_phi.AAC.2
MQWTKNTFARCLFLFSRVHRVPGRGGTAGGRRVTPGQVQGPRVLPQDQAAHRPLPRGGGKRHALLPHRLGRSPLVHGAQHPRPHPHGPRRPRCLTSVTAVI